MGASDPIESSVILFDGICNLCNSSVQFIIRHDPNIKFHFAALQSDFGRAQLEKFKIPKDSYESIVLIIDNKIYQRSNAVLEISKHLNGLLPGFYVFKIIPAFIRDWVYNLIANNRYQWFGKQGSCLIPTPELKARFLD